MVNFAVYICDGTGFVEVEAECPEEALRSVLESHKISEVAYIYNLDGDGVWFTEELIDGDASFDGFK